MDKKSVATIILMLVFAAGIVWIVCFEGTGNDIIADISDRIEKKDTHMDFDYGEIRGIWISYIELNEMIKGKSEKEFKKNIENVIGNMKSLKLNTAIVQVRSFSDAIYKSDYYPQASYCVGKDGNSIKYDPLAVMTEMFHKEGIRIEAWVNPYRVKSDMTKINETSGVIADWINEESNNIVYTDGGVFLNPASGDVRTLIINGIKEIVNNYDVDGIHFDDYFYPQGDSFDEAEYTSYKDGGGELLKADWRRENINEMVKGVYSAIKEIDGGVEFGISPQGNLANDYNVQYIDVEKWIKNDGYVDYICPQIYYGYNNEANGFSSVLSEFEGKEYKSAKLLVGLAAYKVGKEDAYAGKGRNEWINTKGILKRQIDDAMSSGKCSGFVLFRYNSIFEPDDSVKGRVKEECSCLID